MSSFNELMQKYVNEDYSTLVSLAKQALNELLPVCKKVDADHDGFFMVTSIVLSAIAADGYLTALEKKMLKDVLGLSDDSIQKMISLYDSRMVELVDKFADGINDDVKAHVMILVTAVAAVDEKISKEETAFIRKLLN